MSRTIVAPQEYVFDWWTDLSPNDAKLVNPLKSRKILSRTDTEITLEDEEQMYFRKMHYSVKVTMERPKKWIAEYDGTVAQARSEYVLSEIKDEFGKNMTLLEYSTSIAPKGFLTNLFSPLIKPFVKRIFAQEMDVFVRSLQEDFQKEYSHVEEKPEGKESTSKF